MAWYATLIKPSQKSLEAFKTQVMGMTFDHWMFTEHSADLANKAILQLAPDRAMTFDPDGGGKICHF